MSFKFNADTLHHLNQWHCKCITKFYVLIYFLATVDYQKHELIIMMTLTMFAKRNVYKAFGKETYFVSKMLS